MKKYVLMILSLLFFAGESMAQYATPQSPESLIARMQKNAPELYRSYRNGSTLSGVGIGLMAGGLGAIVVGVATGEKNTTTNGLQTNIEVKGTGGAIAAVGTVALLTGTPLMIIGLTKKSRAKRNYLARYGDMGFEQPTLRQSPHLEVHPNGLAFVF
ncbi:MAG: hypothetical protein LBS88_03135 [Tannerellaceae bacterium]|jgi:ABC-type nitrate/sulfonate/bicarbonate transport system permease component|nr:hypothetical protein [Tannerellaceae bacterium]